MAEFRSKKTVVSKAPYELYMAFVDMRNFIQFLPEDKRADVTADYDSIHAVVQGFSIGVRVKDRVPYSRIEFVDDGAPFKFFLTLHFNPSSDPYKTDFEIVLDAELNFMMKTLLGGKLKAALDKVAESLAAVSEGRMPEGIDPSMYPKGFDPSKL
ncbi:MAG: hypothetical protein IKT59_03150 [Bacteroidales bacterium]|jgi:hypothetical protein|nr:hypothetical protein [Bacteroidales bacterium]